MDDLNFHFPAPPNFNPNFNLNLQILLKKLNSKVWLSQWPTGHTHHGSYLLHSTGHHWISAVAAGCLVRAACPRECFCTSTVFSPLTLWYPLPQTRCDWLPETSPHLVASSLSRWTKGKSKTIHQSKAPITQTHLQTWVHSFYPVPHPHDRKSQAQEERGENIFSSFKFIAVKHCCFSASWQRLCFLASFLEGCLSSPTVGMSAFTL